MEALAIEGLLHGAALRVENEVLASLAETSPGLEGTDRRRGSGAASCNTGADAPKKCARPQ